MDKPSNGPKVKNLLKYLASTPTGSGSVFDPVWAGKQIKKTWFNSPSTEHASPASLQSIAVPAQYTNGAPNEVTIEVDQFTNTLQVHTPAGWSHSFQFNPVQGGWETPVGFLTSSQSVQAALPKLLDWMMEDALYSMVLTHTVHHASRDLHLHVKFLGMEFSLRLKYDGLLKGWPIGDYSNSWGIGMQGEFGFLPDEYAEFGKWELSQHTGIRNYVLKKIRDLGISLAHPKGTKYVLPPQGGPKLSPLAPKMQDFHKIGVDLASGVGAFASAATSMKETVAAFKHSLQETVQATDSIKLPAGLESKLTFEEEQIMLKMKAAVQTVPQEIAKAAKAEGMSKTESLVVELVDLQRRIDAVGAEQMIKRKDEVRKLLLGSEEVAEISPSEMVTLEVDSGVVVFSPESEKFELSDLPGVCKAIGLDAFFSIAKVNVTDLRKLLSENEMLSYGKKTKGTRTLKSIVAKTDGKPT